MIAEDLVKEIMNRIENLEIAVFGSGKPKKRKKIKETTVTEDVVFSLNERAFVKRYAAGKSGPKKFTILLAYLAGGVVGKNIELSKVRTHWSKMSAKSLLGKFNMFYPNQAKTQGWVDSKEYGKYSLTNEWQDVL